MWSAENPSEGLAFRDWFYKVAKEENGEPDVSNGHIALEIFSQTISYISHHRRLLGNYNETGFLPPRPSEENLAELNMTIRDFFDRHGLRTLKPLFKLAYTLQGYGYLEEESILYGMIWVTPKLVNGLIEMLKIRKVLRKKRLRRKSELTGTPKGITTLQKGFQPLFQAIVDRHDIPVINHAQISSIERKDDGVSVHYHREYKDANDTLVREDDKTMR